MDFVKSSFEANSDQPVQVLLYFELVYILDNAYGTTFKDIHASLK